MTAPRAPPILPLSRWCAPGAVCRLRRPVGCRGRTRLHASAAVGRDCGPTSGERSPPGWQPVIGLEVHAQIKTNTKLFSPSRVAFADAPNTNISPFDLAFPGTLPVLNKDCVRAAVKAALALGCAVQRKSMFERKHYFYHDLPAGYQITQRHEPIAKNGILHLLPHDGISHEHPVRIEQIQLEQDTAKSILDADPELTLIDMNRAGAALIEIVMKPDLRSSAEAGAAVRKLQATLRHIGVSDANMDEGSFRCDVNVSVHKPGEPFGTRTELKNIAHVRLLVDAIDAEVKRQIALVESGSAVPMESRGYDPDTGETFRLRSKEESPEYRYIPEADLPTLKLDQEFIEGMRADLPEDLDDRWKRIQSQYGLREKEVGMLMNAAGAVAFFEEASQHRDARTVFNWTMHELLGRLGAENLDLEHSPVTPAQVGSIVDGILKTKILTGKLGKEVLRIMMEQKDGARCEEVVERVGMEVMGDEEEVRAVCREIIALHIDKVRDKANKGVVQWFVGQVMKRTKGQAEPRLLQTVMREELGVRGDGFREKPGE